MQLTVIRVDKEVIVFRFLSVGPKYNLSKNFFISWCLFKYV